MLSEDPGAPFTEAGAESRLAETRLGRLDLRDDGLADEILALQQGAYRVEADLIGSDEIPPLSETLEELRSCGEEFLGAYVGSALAGFVSWRLDGITLDLHRLVVDPEHFRLGIGTRLLRAALDAEPRARRAVVQTGARNRPARALYERAGFRELGSREPVPGLTVTLFERHLR